MITILINSYSTLKIFWILFYDYMQLLYHLILTKIYKIGTRFMTVLKRSKV